MRSYKEFKNIYLCRQFVDFRKRINGLAEMVEKAMNHDAFSESLFVFCNKRRDRLNILYWDRTGFVLWHKRLEEAKFIWPKKIEDAVVSLTPEQLGFLLDGYDLWKMKPHRTLNYDCVS